MWPKRDTDELTSRELRIHRKFNSFGDPGLTMRMHSSYWKGNDQKHFHLKVSMSTFLSLFECLTALVKSSL